MKAHLFWIVATMLAVALIVGCKNSSVAGQGGVEGGKQVIKLDSFSYGTSCMIATECISYLVTRKADCSLVSVECVAYQDPWEKKMPLSLIDELEKIVIDKQVITWNGFKGNNTMILDGSSFSLQLKCSDGTSVSASGHNAFPKNYREFDRDVRNALKPIYDEYTKLHEE